MHAYRFGCTNKQKCKNIRIITILSEIIIVGVCCMIPSTLQTNSSLPHGDSRDSQKKGEKWERLKGGRQREKERSKTLKGYQNEKLSVDITCM